jgi:uncharacterized SAM-binding protein YcdF (DUF218 family)
MRRTYRNILIAVLSIVVVSAALIGVSVPILESYLVVAKPLEHADAIVVMAGDPQERLPMAAELYKKGVAPKILLTNDGILGGWSVEQERNFFQVEWARHELLKMRVASGAIETLPYSSSGTVHDVLQTRAAALNKGMKSLVIVTSDYHTRRSLWTFEKFFRGTPVTIGIYPAKSKAVSSPFCRKFTLLGYEMLKYLYYRSRY